MVVIRVDNWFDLSALPQPYGRRRATTLIKPDTVGRAPSIQWTALKYGELAGRGRPLVRSPASVHTGGRD